MDETLPWFRELPADQRAWVMLVAQAGVVIASVALARRKMSVFWVLASAAGVVAVLAGLYVYLTS